MAGSLSDAMEIELLKQLTGQTTSIYTTTPIVPYVALFTVTPTDAAASGTEATGGGYARIVTTGKWAVPAAGSVANNATITFASFSGSVSAGAAFVAFGLFTAVTAGTMLAWGALTDVTKTGSSGDTVSFAAGALVITAD